MDDLDLLIKKIFEIVPAYYDKKEADEIKKIILEYMKRKEEKK